MRTSPIITLIALSLLFSCSSSKEQAPNTEPEATPPATAAPISAPEVKFSAGDSLKPAYYSGGEFTSASKTCRMATSSWNV